MKKALTYLFLTGFMAVSCQEPEPRMWTQKRSGTFMKASIERSIDLLNQEEERIQAAIKADSLHGYQQSSYGFNYYIKGTLNSAAETPKENDEILLTYNVKTLDNQIIYTKKDIGIIQAKVDKSKLFPGLRNGIKLLKEGEEGTFIFPSSLAFGYKGENNKIVPNTPVVTYNLLKS